MAGDMCMALSNPKYNFPGNEHCRVETRNYMKYNAIPQHSFGQTHNKTNGGRGEEDSTVPTAWTHTQASHAHAPSMSSSVRSNEIGNKMV